MRDDLPRLLSPPTLPNGLPEPAPHGEAAYLLRARAAALAGGEGKRRRRLAAAGLLPRPVSFAPVRVKAVVAARADWARPAAAHRVAEVALERGRRRSRSRSKPRPSPKPPRRRAPAARCRRWPAAAATAARSSTARGRGCGPTSPPPSTGWRRPPRAPGIALVVNSAFRSDAEQAALFAAHPDPRWVAPPGHSLHRCATELDLGPDSAYGWLAANAGRFGFVQRYSWEPWHYGYDGRPAALLGGRERGRERGAAGETALSRAPAACPPSSPPASGRRCCAPPPAGTSPPRCSPRS